jgi:hypothetical protein
MNSGRDYKAFAAKVAQPIMAAGQTHGNQGGDVIVSQSKMFAEERGIRPTPAKESESAKQKPCTPSAKPNSTLSPSPKTSEENSAQARLPLNSVPEAENPEVDIQQSPIPCEGTNETTPMAEVSTSPTLLEKTQEAQGKRIIAPTLSTKNEVASSSSSRDKWMETCSEILMTVRRLTPTECETLQAFPKGWTLPATEHWGTRSRRRSGDG